MQIENDELEFIESNLFGLMNSNALGVRRLEPWVVCGAQFVCKQI